MKKALKVIGIVILSIIAIVVVVVSLFLNLSPQFGKSPTQTQKEIYAAAENFEKGKFTNTHDSPMDIKFWGMMSKWLAKAPNRSPAKQIIVEKIDSTSIAQRIDSTTQLTWFGHSTFLLEMDGKKILIDPMLGDVPAPHPSLGKKRFSNGLPIDIEQLPFIDAVIFSHDHYDHLDYGSVQKLKGKVGRYFTPLGLGNHLISWGVDSEKISELKWWDDIAFDEMTFVCTPARHFSGRGVMDRASTLWCSWVIQGANDKIYFSGDSGYDTHFKEIGEKYGPFDIALMECGQYNVDWKYIHMMPEETVQAAIDVKSKVALPIHWGGFELAFHDWTDPIVRFLSKAEELNMPVTTPRIGEPIILGSENYPLDKWWEEYEN